MELWVKPELEKRKKSGKVKDDFSLNKCLIKMPHNKPAVVEFNDECRWIITARKDHDASFQENDPVHYFQINKILDVQPPKINNEQVAFIFLHIVKGEWRIHFDFAPGHEGWSRSEGEWGMGKVIADSLQESLEEQTAADTVVTNKLLNDVGLWCIPALIHYPLSKIIKQLSENNKNGAIKTLQKFCNASFLENRIVSWFDNTIFVQRKKLIQEAYTAHKQESYSLSISTLLPQVEGIITDWMQARIPEADIPWRQISKVRKLSDLVLKSPTVPPDNIIVISVVNFIENGPLFKTFKKWTESIDPAFPNRHVVGHGKYAESVFTELNSIKIFLLLDTLHYIISEN